MNKNREQANTKLVTDLDDLLIIVFISIAVGYLWFFTRVSLSPTCWKVST
jgi:hypothetical protein